MSLACACAIRTISFSSRLRTSKPHGQRRLLSSLTNAVLPLVPVRVHPHADLGLTFKELAEEVTDLGGLRELREPLQRRPRIDAKEPARIARVEVHHMREVT